MVLIFYDAEEEVIRICTDNQKMKTIRVDDPELLSYIPNEDILYVSKAQYITKTQLEDWLNGTAMPEVNEPIRQGNSYIEPDVDYSNSQWIHPAHNGYICIEDIKTSRFPNGLEMDGKYDFINVEILGGLGVLNKSAQFRGFLNQGKIKVADYEYVKKHQSKNTKFLSGKDRNLDRILVPANRSAVSVAENGGIRDDDFDGEDDFLVEIER
jgi:hypothetical protein